MLKKLIIAIILFLVAVFIIGLMNGRNLGTSPTGFLARKCDVNTVTAVAVGDDLTTEVLASYSNRAWASISVADGEVEPVFLSFDEGADATVNNGIVLTATGTPTITFGLNDHFAYTGAIDAITGTASTTLHVTECRY